MVRLLLEAGANPRLKNASGRSMISYATGKSREIIEAWMREHPQEE